MSWLPPELQFLTVVAAATLDESGKLIDANAGFVRLVQAPGLKPIGPSVGEFFLQPDFRTLVLARPDGNGTVHEGPLTIGDRTGKTWSLRTRIWRVDGNLRVLAEYDVEGLEGRHDRLLDLDRRYADVQAQLTEANRKLQQCEAEIVEVSQTDALTGVGNRRRLDQVLVTEISRCDRTGEQLSAMMADLDHFKRVNDQYGHEAGDKVLAAFGELLRQHTRATDVVTRFGGEEFVVLLPHTDREQARVMAERVRQAFASLRIEPLRDPVTVSIGVAELLPGERAEGLLRGIDKALYQAKHSGRNRVVVG